MDNTAQSGIPEVGILREVQDSLGMDDLLELTGMLMAQVSTALTELFAEQGYALNPIEVESWGWVRWVEALSWVRAHTVDRSVPLPGWITALPSGEVKL